MDDNSEEVRNHSWCSQRAWGNGRGTAQGLDETRNGFQSRRDAEGGYNDGDGFPVAAVTHGCQTGTESSALKRHLQRQWHAKAKQRGRGREKRKPEGATESLARSTRRRTLPTVSKEQERPRARDSLR